MKNLLSNTEFGVYLNTLNLSDSEYRFLRNNYDCFLLRNSKIWMFAPSVLVANKWVILQEPEYFKLYNNNLNILNWQDHKFEGFFDDEEDFKEWIMFCMEYQEAKDRVLFKNIEIQNTEDWISFYGGIRVFNFNPNIEIQNNFSFVFKENKNYTSKKTLEDLLKYDLFLSKSALKEIGVFNYCNE